MYNSQKILNDYWKPKYGLKYRHLTEEEMAYITNHNNCDSSKRFIKMKEFISAHTNLEEFENRIKDSTQLDIKRDYPFWYIAHLVSYGRISVTYQVLRRITGNSYNELRYEDAPFVNTKFLKDFKQEGERLGYSNAKIKIDLRELIVISIFFNVRTEQIPNMFHKYIKFFNENSILNRCAISSIYNVFLSMGYNLLEAEAILNCPPKKQYISENMKHEFSEGLDEYIKLYSGKKDEKTVKCVRSHLLVFFNYIADEFSEIERLCSIENKHLQSFIEYQLNNKNYSGKINSPGTINSRTKVISQIWRFFIKLNKYKITSNIVTPYDKIKEPKKYAIYISKEDTLKLFNALKNVSDGRFLLLKYIITILLETGRRIHEVLSLQFNCINPINGKKHIYFHKLKHDKPSMNILINKQCEIAVLKLQEMATKFKRPLRSRNDNLIVKRLFPSLKYKGRNVLSEQTVSRMFDEFQILNNIVNKEGNALFNIHDIKRTYVLKMLGLGYSADIISKLLNQDINTLLPYESNNETAIKTLKLAEKKGLLIGNAFVNEYDGEGEENNQFKKRIIELLKNTDISNRHKENLAYKLKNPQEEVPLYFGVCTDKDSILVCGTLICIACDDVLLDSIDTCEEFFVKMYKYIYRNKRNKDIKAVEQQLKIACENIYIKKEKINETEMKNRINFIKKQAREYVRDEMV